MKEKSVRCDCAGGEHYLHFTVFPEDKDEPKQIYVDLNAKIQWPLLSRIKEALKLLQGKAGCYDGIILNKEKSFEIASFLLSVFADDVIKEKT